MVEEAGVGQGRREDPGGGINSTLRPWVLSPLLPTSLMGNFLGGKSPSPSFQSPPHPQVYQMRIYSLLSPILPTPPFSSLIPGGKGRGLDTCGSLGRRGMDVGASSSSPTPRVGYGLADPLSMG